MIGVAEDKHPDLIQQFDILEKQKDFEKTKRSLGEVQADYE